MEYASTIINREANLLKNRTQEMEVIFKDLGYNDIDESWDRQVIDRWVEADNQEESTNGFFGNRALECDPMIQNCTIILNTLPPVTPPPCIIRREPFTEVKALIQNLRQEMDLFQRLLNGQVIVPGSTGSTYDISTDTILDFIIGKDRVINAAGTDFEFREDTQDIDLAQYLGTGVVELIDSDNLNMGVLHTFDIVIEESKKITDTLQSISNNNSTQY